ncbi:MAG TPA: hypothetical protein VFB06_09500 [Streptosporangiaceae bacterium]|nr:hypothetical protein [Streptosporangiaceae bacterium]
MVLASSKARPSWSYPVCLKISTGSPADISRCRAVAGSGVRAWIANRPRVGSTPYNENSTSYSDSVLKSCS